MPRRTCPRSTATSSARLLPTPRTGNLVKPVLNFMQTAVSLSYLPANEVGDGKLFTQMSILHDLRALEPLRKSLPALYAEMSKRAFTAEAGRFYLLDSITGAAHAE